VPTLTDIIPFEELAKAPSPWPQVVSDLFISYWLLGVKIKFQKRPFKCWLNVEGNPQNKKIDNEKSMMELFNC
jgi:hypothetical protein